MKPLPMTPPLLSLPRWTLFCLAMIGGASLTGSLISAIGVIGGLVATWILIRTKDAPRASGPVRVTAWIFGLYFATLTLTTLLNGPDPARHIEYLIIAPFLYFIPLMLVIERADAVPSLTLISRAAMIGAVPTALLALWFTFVMGVYRPELAPQNQNVLSGLLVMQTILCLCAWSKTSPRARGLALAAALVVVVALVLSVQTRGALLALAAMGWVSVVYFGLRVKGPLRWAISLGALASLAAVLFVVMPALSSVLDRVLQDDFSDWSHSNWQRAMMYKAGVEVFLDNPWLGVGMHERFSATLPYYAGETPDWLYFTHLHNIILTHATAGGIPAILAVLAVILLPAGLALGLRNLPTSLRWLGVMLSTGLFTLGLTETVLFHDLNTTFHMFNTVTFALLCAKAQRA